MVARRRRHRHRHRTVKPLGCSLAVACASCFSLPDALTNDATGHGSAAAGTDAVSSLTASDDGTQPSSDDGSPAATGDSDRNGTSDSGATTSGTTATSVGPMSTTTVTSGDSGGSQSTGSEDTFGGSTGPVDHCCDACEFACDQDCECWIIYDNFERTFDPWSYSPFTGPQLSIVALGADDTAHSLRFASDPRRPSAYSSRELPLQIEPTDFRMWLGLDGDDSLNFGFLTPDATFPTYLTFTPRGVIADPSAGFVDYAPSGTGWYHVELADIDWAAARLTLIVNGTSYGRIQFSAPDGPIDRISLSMISGFAFVDELRIR